jgi:hypothetical protein
VGESQFEASPKLAESRYMKNKLKKQKEWEWLKWQNASIASSRPKFNPQY